MSEPTCQRPKRSWCSDPGHCKSASRRISTNSGFASLKALKEEKITTILINPNIATIQTSDELADRIYLVAITPELSRKIIVQERSTQSCYRSAAKLPELRPGPA